MPRLPVDGKKVVEHRITLGTFERQQVERFIDGMQIKNIGTGVGAATDPIEALFGTTVGATGGLFIAAWALKRFFNVDVPIPTDLEDITEGWLAIYGAVTNITTEGRQEIADYIDQIDLKEKAEVFGLLAQFIPGYQGVKLTTKLLHRAADFIFTPLDNPRFDPNYGDIYADYVDPGLETGGEVGIPPAEPPSNPYGLTNAERDCVLEKWNIYQAGFDPALKTRQQVSLAMTYDCGLTPAKAQQVFLALENGESI